MSNPTYTYAEQGYVEGFEAADDAEAIERGRDMLQESIDGHPSPEATQWRHAEVLAADEVIDTITIRVDPDEPPCARKGGGHSWATVDVRGHGGGVIITERCTWQTCAVRRVTDTWAQDRLTGEQGLTAIRYEVRDEAEAW